MASTLAQKLKIKPGMRLALINAPADFYEDLGALPQDVLLVIDPATEVDYAHLFVTSTDQLRHRAPDVIERLTYDGLFWVSWPKKTSKVATELTRDVVWARLAEVGYKGVAAVSINAVWSALRFRPSERVGK